VVHSRPVFQPCWPLSNGGSAVNYRWFPSSRCWAPCTWQPHFTHYSREPMLTEQLIKYCLFIFFLHPASIVVYSVHCDGRVCLFVCLFVCRHAYLSYRTSKLTKCSLPVCRGHGLVLWCSSNTLSILLVFWMTSCFLIMGATAAWR